MKKIFCLAVCLVLLLSLGGCGKKEEPPSVGFLRGFLNKFYVSLDAAALKETTRTTRAKADQVLRGLRNDHYYPKLALGFDLSGLQYALSQGGGKTDSKAVVAVSGALLVKTTDFPSGRSVQVDFPVTLHLNRDRWEVEFTKDFFQYSTIEAGDDLGIVAGPRGGRNYLMALDLRMLGKRAGLNIYVYEGKGAEDHIMAVAESEKIQLGFMQHDALLFVQSGLSKIPAIKTQAKKIRSLLPLYTEAVQIVGQRRIKELGQFSGKIVAVGEPESTSFITGNLVFYLGGVPTHSLLAAGGEQALSALQRQKVDGLLQVGTGPLTLFSGIRPEARMHLIPVTSPTLRELYPFQEIPAASYSWREQTAVATIGVKMVLATRNYSGSRCKVIGYFADMIRANMDWLRAKGEAAWKGVDLDAPLPGWRTYACLDKTKRRDQGSYH